MRRLNATVSGLLLKALEGVVGQRGVSSEGVMESVGELSKLFTKERRGLPDRYLNDPKLAAAYVQYFLPVNLSKIQILLDEMPALMATDRMSVLDLGSGPGTGDLAVLDWWHRRYAGGKLNVIAIDKAGTALRHAEDLWNRYCHGAGIQAARLRTIKSDVEEGTWIEQVRGEAPFELIVLANCLNELTESIEARVRFVVSALSLLAPHGTMMIVEPALRETSRALHQVRNQVLQQNLCTVYSPCLHENGCPALIKEDDWCHEERAWVPPVSIQAIDREVGFIKDVLKFSYLLLRKDGKTIVERRTDRSRVVSELREMKGEKRAWLCNEQGRLEIGRLDRLASLRNAAFDDWHRGAIVQIERIVWKEREGKVSAVGRIERDAEVELIRPA